MGNIIKTLNDIPPKTKKVKDNMKKLRPALNQLINRIKANELIIKKAGKGSMVVIMGVRYYWEMCREHLSNNMLYINLGSNDPTEKITLRMNYFAIKYKSKLNEKEYQYLINNDKRMANFYMLPKIHKSEERKKEIEKRNEEYIQMINIKVEGRNYPLYYI